MTSPLLACEFGDVRVLVQNVQTGEYYSLETGWTLDPDAACDFFSSFEAQDFCGAKRGKWQVVFQSAPVNARF